jgi:hypothetical protein
VPEPINPSPEAAKQHSEAIGRFTASRMREPSSLEMLAWRADLSKTIPAALADMVALGRERRKQHYTGQVVRSAQRHDNRMYRHLEDDVYEDITDAYTCRHLDEPAPTWYKDLRPFDEQPDNA